MEKEDIFLGSALLAVAASTALLWPFADAILWAVFTAYFLHYFADHLNARLNNRTITTAIVILVLVGFVAGLSLLLITSLNTDSVQQVTYEFKGILFNTVDIFVDFLQLPETLRTNLKDTIDNVTRISSTHILQMAGEVPSVIINLLVFLVVSAFLVKDGKRFKDDLFHVVNGLPDEYQSIAYSVVTSIDDLFRGVFLTYMIVAIAVGALATAGFYILGVPFYWGWGIVIGIFAFFPVVSAPMVYIPLSLFYIADGYFLGGVTIFMYGVLVLNTLPEVLFRPYLAAHQTQEHPIILFIGFIVGPLVLGLKGIILGPMILVVTKNLLTMKYWDVDVTMPPAPVKDVTDSAA